MKIISFFLFYTFCLISLLSCSNGPQPIAYGEDECHECKMLIIDNKFGAELITDKGKIYKFDSAECLVDYINKTTHTRQSWVVNYLDPKQLINAEDAYYVISKKLPSPMGGFITSYSSKEKAQTQVQTYTGDFYNWSNLCKLRGK